MTGTADEQNDAIPRHIARDVLNLPMQSNDAEASTVREYLLTLLSDLWRLGEDFNVKRPFGNSSWQHELYDALARTVLVKATFDADGWLESVDHRRADLLIQAAIQELGR